MPGQAGATRLGHTEELLRIRPYVSVGGVYDSGLTGPLTDEAGRVRAHDAYGVVASFGVLGYHSWRKTLLGISYEGSARHYTRQAYYDGVDQSLALEVAHRLSRRVRLELNESAASRRGGFLGMPGYLLFNPEFERLTENTIFDARTYVLASTARAVFEKSQRLSFSFGGTVLGTQPRSRALVRARGVSAIGETAYRLTRRQSIGLAYTFIHYWFPGAFGEAWAHGSTLYWTRLVGRRTNLALGLGGYRVETIRLQQVTIDPVIAAIIGQRVGIEVFHRITYVPSLHAGITRQYRRASLGLHYARGISAGNEIYLTSAQETAGISFGYTGTRRWHFSADAGYSRLSSLSQTLGRFRHYHAGAGFTCLLGRGVSLYGRIDGRKYQLAGTGFGRLYYRASVGLSFSPGEIPLALW